MVRKNTTDEVKNSTPTVGEDINLATKTANKTEKKVSATKKTIKANADGDVVKSKKSTTTKKTASAVVDNVAKDIKTDVINEPSIAEIKSVEVAVKPKRKTSKAKNTDITKVVVKEKKAKKTENVTKKYVETKEKVQKAESSKFMNKKIDIKPVEQVSCSKCNGCQTIQAFINGYKNIFNYNGRTSRFEFWGFLLITIILAVITSALSIPLFVDNNLENKTGTTVALFIVLLIIVLAGLSMTVRRLHDLGFKGWKGFFAPLTYTFLILCGLFGWAQYEILSIMKDSGYTISPNLFNHIVMTANKTAFGIGFILFVITLIVHIYYIFKTFIVVGFFEGENNVNEYGEPKYTDVCYRNITIRYIAIYYTIFTILELISDALSFVLGYLRIY